VSRRRTYARSRVSSAWRVPSSLYRGTAGLREVYFLAELDADYQVIARVGPTYHHAAEALIAYARRTDPKLRLVREIIVREVAA
jgi:hypothetical protein